MPKHKFHGKAGNILKKISQKRKNRKRAPENIQVHCPPRHTEVQGCVRLHLLSLLILRFGGKGLGAGRGVEINRKANQHFPKMRDCYKQWKLNVQTHGESILGVPQVAEKKGERK